jgi:GRAM domain-containing protein 4
MLINIQGFWILWLYDLLLPALMIRILWEMLSRKFFPYPTFATLQDRRKDSDRAREFGDGIQERLSVSSVGPKEIFQLFKSYKSAAKNKMKSVAKDPGATPPVNDAGEDEADTVLDKDSQEEQDIKRDLLRLLDTLADIHERIKKFVMFCF